MGEASEDQSSKHMPTGQWRIGLLLAVITVILWSTVPIALSLLLDAMDAVTITWYRFLVSGLAIAGYLAAKSEMPPFGNLMSGNGPWLVAVSAIGLTGGFTLYLYALNFISPGASQVVIQLGPLFVLLGGVALYKESFRTRQWGGFVGLIVGLLLFFNQRLNELTGSPTEYSFGAMIVVLAAIVWASYALAQKQLLRVCSSSGVMLLLYTSGCVMMLPFCSLTQVGSLDLEQSLVLAYSCANTLIGYGCFAKAFEHWEASRVSAVTATTPLLTLALSHVASTIWPDQIIQEDLNLASYVGAVLVVIGAMLVALGGKSGDSVKTK